MGGSKGSGGNQNAGSGGNKSSGGATGGGGGGAKAAGGTGASMKAPGRDYTISRDSFESNPAAYFKDLRK
ncbi:hypothetical protein ACFX13_011438 [Malus domestica]|uniref:Uncharacterized protein n=1 Tax=Malus domestica TaxID=3750 RepID=A0A498IBR8_MALDO|nr:hypothetical protein DVH24_040582 [Malus domestica]